MQLLNYNISANIISQITQKFLLCSHYSSNASQILLPLTISKKLSNFIFSLLIHYHLDVFFLRPSLFAKWEEHKFSWRFTRLHWPPNVVSDFHFTAQWAYQCLFKIKYKSVFFCMKSFFSSSSSHFLHFFFLLACLYMK